MGCRKCGARAVEPKAPQYRVTGTLKTVDGETATVQFRARISFTYNDMPFSFSTSQVIRLNYVHILAALAIDKNILLFLNPAEKMDFIDKHPEARTYNI